MFGNLSYALGGGGGGGLWGICPPPPPPPGLNPSKGHLHLP